MLLTRTLSQDLPQRLGSESALRYHCIEQELRPTNVLGGWERPRYIYTITTTHTVYSFSIT